MKTLAITIKYEWDIVLGYRYICIEPLVHVDPLLHQHSTRETSQIPRDKNLKRKTHYKRIQNK